MALNFDGLGIRVSFEDEGAGKKIRGLSDVTSELWDTLKKAGSIAGNVGRKFGRGLGQIGNMGRRSLGGITNAIGGMVEAAMSPQLDHAYSSMYAGFNKTFSAMTVGIKGTSKEMKQARKVIGGVAFGLNEDMDAAATTWAAFRKQNVDLTKVLGTRGLKGAMKDIIKITSVFEVEGEQLSTVISGLINGFGFSAEGAGLLADKVFTVGKAFNAGREAIQSWPAIFESLNNELADFGKNMTPKDIEALTLSIVQFGGALSQSLGIPAQSAMEIARTAFTTLAGERKNIINMFRGMGGEFGEVARQLMETGGDANKIFEMLSTGDPLKFMDTLREMAKVAEQRGGETGIAFQRLSGVMAEALGPDVAFAAKGNWDKVQGTLAGIPEAIAGNKAMGALKSAAAQHHKTGLTAGESWDRMIEGMKARLFKLSDKEIGGWRKNMKKGFDETFGVISKLAKADGPVGELTKRLLAVQRVGLSAMLPGLEGLMPLFGGVFNSMIPVMTALGSMGVTFGSLGKMALGGGALWAVFNLLKYGPEEAFAKIKKFASDVWNTLGELFPQLHERVLGFFDRFKKMDMGKAIAEWFAGIDFGTIFRGIGDFLARIPWEGILDAALGLVKGIAGGLGKLINSLITNVDWGAFAKRMFGLAWKAIQGIGSAVTALLRNIFAKKDPETDKVLKAGMGDLFMGALMFVKDMALGAVRGFWASIFDAKSVGGAVENLVKVVAGGMLALLVISKNFRAKFIGGFRGMFAGVRRISKSNWRAIGRMTRIQMKKMVRTFRRGAKMIGGAGLFFGLFTAMEQLKVRSKNAGEIMASNSIRESEKAALAAEQGFMGIMDTLDSVFFGLPGMLGEALGISRDDLSGFYHEMVGGFESAINAVVEFFSMGWENVSASFNAFLVIVEQGWRWMVAGVEGIIGEVVLAWKSALNWIQTKMLNMSETVESAFVSLGQGIMYPFQWLSHKLKGWMADLLESLFGTAGKPSILGEMVKRFDEKLFKGVTDTVRTLKYEWKQEGGEDFERAQGRRNEEEMRRLRESYDERRKALEEDKRKMEEVGAQAAADLSNSQDAAINKLRKASMDAALGNVQRFEDMTRSVDEYHDRAMDAARETAETSRKERARLKEDAEKAERRAMGLGGGRVPKKKKITAASAAERGEMAQPKDLAVRGLVNNVTSLTKSMSDFVKNPIAMNLKVSGDVGKFLKFSRDQERRRTPLPLAR